MTTIRVLYKPAGGPMELRTITNTLAACQELVDGYIEPVTLATDLVLVCNDEGVIRGLGSNPFLGYNFRGDWFLCGRDEDEFADIPEDTVAWFRQAGMIGEARDGRG